MRQNFIFADQRCGCDLRHHEARVQSGARCEKWRQTFAQRGIHQSLNPSLADACQCAESNRQKIQGECQRLAMKISSGDYVALSVLRISDEDQWVINRGVGLRLEHFSAVAERVANCTMHLRNTAKRVSILHAAALAVRFADLAALEHASQVCRGFHLAGMRTSLVDALVKSCVCAFERITAESAERVS